MIGKKIFQYKILKKLGEGGMGVVYKANDQRLKRAVALKFLPPHLGLDDEAKQRFTLEAQATSALDHPNICTIYDISQTEPAQGESEEGQLFIVMAFYSGETLKAKIGRGQLPVEKALDFAEQIAEGLARVHEAKIIHRDIKPANVMVTDGDRVKLLDFGLAKLAVQPQLTRTGTTMGTVAYMSPEQARSEAIDHRTDLWSLGVVLYEMLTGQRPFDADYEQVILYAVINEEPLPVEQLRPEVSKELSAIVRRLLEKDLSGRYQSAKEVLDELRALHMDLNSMAAPVHPDSEGKPVKNKRSKVSRKWLILGLPTVFLVLTFFTVGIFYRFGIDRITVTDPVISKNRIAVLPFSVGGGEELSYLEDSMVDLLSIGLDEAGGLESVEPNTLLGYLGKDRGPVRDPVQALQVAAHFGAGRFILGSVTRLGRQIRFNASMYDAVGQFQERAEVETSDEEMLPSIIDTLVIQLIGGLVDQPLQELVPVAAKTTTSFKALKAYLRAEHLMRLGKEKEAAEAARESVQLDSTFALAWWLYPDFELADQMTKKYRDKLPKRMQHLGDAIDKAVFDDSTDFEEKRKQFLQVVENYPDFAMVRFYYADFYLYHEGWFSGHPSSEARPHLERALRYDPNHAEIINHLLELVAKAGEFDVLDSLLIKYKEEIVNYNGEKYYLALQALSAAGHDNQKRFELLLQKLVATESDAVHWRLPIFLAQWLEDIPRAFYASHLFQQREPERYRGYSLLREGPFEMAAGRIRRSDSLLTKFYSKISPEQPDRANAILLQVLMRFCAVHPAPREQLEELRREIEGWDTSRVGWRGRTEIKAFNRGLLSHRLKDKMSFGEARAELERLAASKGNESVEHAMASTMTALAFWQEGQGIQALAALDNASRAIMAEKHEPFPGLPFQPGRPSQTSAPAYYLVLNMYLLGGNSLHRGALRKCSVVVYSAQRQCSNRKGI